MIRTILRSFKGLFVYIIAIAAATIILTVIFTVAGISREKYQTLENYASFGIGAIVTMIYFARGRAAKAARSEDASSKGTSVMEQLNWRSFPLGLKGAALAVGTGILANLSVNSAANLLGVGENATEANWLAIRNSGHGWEILLMLLVVAVLTPLTEELLFRGIMFHTLRSKLNVSVSAVVTSLLFGAMHLEPFLIVSTSLMGMLFTIFMLRYKTIYAAVLVHLSFNLSSFALMALFVR